MLLGLATAASIPPAALRRSLLLLLVPSGPCFPVWGRGAAAAAGPRLRPLAARLTAADLRLLIPSRSRLVGSAAAATAPSPVLLRPTGRPSALPAAAAAGSGSSGISASSSRDGGGSSGRGVVGRAVVDQALGAQTQGLELL